MASSESWSGSSSLLGSSSLVRYSRVSNFWGGGQRRWGGISGPLHDRGGGAEVLVNRSPIRYCKTLISAVCPIYQFVSRYSDFRDTRGATGSPTHACTDKLSGASRASTGVSTLSLPRLFVLNFTMYSPDPRRWSRSSLVG